jgi:hypothetical protein
VVSGRTDCRFACWGVLCVFLLLWVPSLSAAWLLRHCAIFSELFLTSRSVVRPAYALLGDEVIVAALPVAHRLLRSYVCCNQWYKGYLLSSNRGRSNNAPHYLLTTLFDVNTLFPEKQRCRFHHWAGRRSDLLCPQRLWRSGSLLKLVWT